MAENIVWPGGCISIGHAAIPSVQSQRSLTKESHVTAPSPFRLALSWGRIQIFCLPHPRRQEGMDVQIALRVFNVSY